MDPASRLRIAIQKSGRLTDHSLDLLVRCGLKYSRGKDQLMCYGDNMPLDLLFVRDDDIPDLVQEDVCDLGIVGLNVIEEKRLELAARGISYCATCDAAFFREKATIVADGSPIAVNIRASSLERWINARAGASASSAFRR